MRWERQVAAILFLSLWATGCSEVVDQSVVFKAGNWYKADVPGLGLDPTFKVLEVRGDIWIKAELAEGERQYYKLTNPVWLNSSQFLVVEELGQGE